MQEPDATEVREALKRLDAYWASKGLPAEEGVRPFLRAVVELRLSDGWTPDRFSAKVVDAELAEKRIHTNHQVDGGWAKATKSNCEKHLRGAYAGELKSDPIRIGFDQHYPVWRKLIDEDEDSVGQELLGAAAVLMKGAVDTGNLARLGQAMEVLGEVRNADPTNLEAQCAALALNSGFVITGSGSKETLAELRVALEAVRRSAAGRWEVNLAVGVLEFMDEWRWESGIRRVQKAIEDSWDGKTRIHQMSPAVMIGALWSMREFDKAGNLILERVSDGFERVLFAAGHATLIGEFEAAERMLIEMMRVDERFLRGRIALAEVYEATGQKEKALDVLREVTKEWAGGLWVMVRVLRGLCGDSRSIEDPEERPAPWGLGEVIMGQPREAAEMLYRSVAEERWGVPMLSLRVRPLFRHFRAEKKYLELLSLMGLEP